MDELREEVAKLYDMVKTAKLMNEERKQKLRWLVELMQDTIFEEEMTQNFFKDIRGGHAT